MMSETVGEAIQVVFARELSENLRDCGHDVSTLDLLDCLASTNLILAASQENVASGAYFNELARRFNELTRRRG